MRMIAAPLVALEFAHQVEDLRLDGHVERGGRLVGDQQFADRRRAPWRSWRAGACRRRACADSRRCAAPATGMPHAPQQLDGALARLRAGQAAMAHQHLDDLLADGVARIERGHRLLEDHREPVAAQVAQRAVRQDRAARCRRTCTLPETSAACLRQQAHDRRATSRSCRSRTRRRCRACCRARASRITPSTATRAAAAVAVKHDAQVLDLRAAVRVIAVTSRSASAAGDLGVDAARGR